jgi:hypothetical protein
MAITQQEQALQLVNAIMATAAQIMSLYTQMSQQAAQWTDQQTASTVSNLDTVERNPDGSLGAADSTPNDQNPIDPTKYPSLARALSEMQIVQIKRVCDDLVAYIAGQQVGPNPGARAILMQAVG